MSVHTANKAKKLRRSVARMLVFCLGSAHLTLMSSIGLWVWSNPRYFELRSTHFACSVDNAWIFVFFHRFDLSSEVLRWLSIVGYGLILVPWWNLVIPAAIFLTIQLAHHKFVASRSKTRLPHHHNTSHSRTEASRVPALIGLLILAAVNFIILASNEISIQGVRHIQDPGESDWTFGQVLSLLLLVLPLRDAIRFATEKNGNRLSKQLGSDSTRPTGLDNDTESGSSATGREGSPSLSND